MPVIHCFFLIRSEKKEIREFFTFCFYNSLEKLKEMLKLKMETRSEKGIILEVRQHKL